MARPLRHEAPTATAKERWLLDLTLLLLFAAAGFTAGRASKRSLPEYVERVVYVEAPPEAGDIEPSHCGDVYGFEDAAEAHHSEGTAGTAGTEDSEDSDSQYAEIAGWRAFDNAALEVSDTRNANRKEPVPTPVPLAAAFVADVTDSGLGLLVPSDNHTATDEASEGNVGWAAFLSFENVIFLLGAVTTVGGALYTAASSWSSAATAMRFGMVEGLLSLVAGICALFSWRLSKSEETEPAGKALALTVAVLSTLTAAAASVAFDVTVTFGVAGLAASSLFALFAAHGLRSEQPWRFPVALLTLSLLGALSGSHLLISAGVAAMGVLVLLPSRDADETAVNSRTLLLSLFLGGLALVMWRLDVTAAVMAPAMAAVALASPIWFKRFVSAPAVLVSLIAAAAVLAATHYLLLPVLVVGFIGLWRGLASQSNGGNLGVATDFDEASSHHLVGLGIVATAAALAVAWAPVFGLVGLDGSLLSYWGMAAFGAQVSAFAIASAWHGFSILAVTLVAVAAASSLSQRSLERAIAQVVALVTLSLALLTVLVSAPLQPLVSAALLWTIAGLTWALGRFSTNTGADSEAGAGDLHWTHATFATPIATGFALIACGLTAYGAGWSQWYLAAFFGAVAAGFSKSAVIRGISLAAIAGCLSLALSIGPLPSVWPSVLASTLAGLLLHSTRLKQDSLVLVAQRLSLISLVGAVVTAALTTTLAGPNGASLDLLALLVSAPLLAVALLTRTTSKLSWTDADCVALGALSVIGAFVIGHAEAGNIFLLVAGAITNGLVMAIGLRNTAVRCERDGDLDAQSFSIGLVEVAVTAALAIPTLFLPSADHWIGVAILTLSGLWLGRTARVDPVTQVAQPLGWWLLLVAAGWAGWLAAGVSGVLVGSTGLTLLTCFAAPLSDRAKRHANEASLVGLALFAAGTLVVLLPDVGQFVPVTVTAALAAGVGVMFATGPSVLNSVATRDAHEVGTARQRHLLAACFLGVPAIGLAGPWEWIGPVLLLGSAVWLVLKRDDIFETGDRRWLAWLTAAGASAWAGWLLFGAFGPLTALAVVVCLTGLGLGFGFGFGFGLPHTNDTNDTNRLSHGAPLMVHLTVYVAALTALVEPSLAVFFVDPLTVALGLASFLAIATRASDSRGLHRLAVHALFLPLVFWAPVGWPCAAVVAGLSALWLLAAELRDDEGRLGVPSPAAWQLGVSMAVGGWLWDTLAGATLGLSVFTLGMMLLRARIPRSESATRGLPEVGASLVVLSAAWSTYMAPFGPVHLPLVFGWGLAVVVALTLALGRRPMFGTYLAEASLGGLLAMLRYRTPVLDGLAGYEALFVAGAAILMVGASQLLRRRNTDEINEAATAIQRTAALLPLLIPALIEWNGHMSEAFALAAGGLAHAALARSNRSMFLAGSPPGSPTQRFSRLGSRAAPICGLGPR